jgi:hypothetical protein
MRRVNGQTPTPEVILEHKEEVIQALRDKDIDWDYHFTIANALRQGVGGVRLAEEYSEIIDALRFNVLMEWLGEFPNTKLDHIASAAPDNSNLALAVEEERQQRKEDGR